MLVAETVSPRQSQSLDSLKLRRFQLIDYTLIAGIVVLIIALTGGVKVSFGDINIGNTTKKDDD